MLQQATPTRSRTVHYLVITVALLLSAGIVWYWLARPDDARVVSHSADSAAPVEAAKPLRIMDVLAGIPEASKSERGNDSDGRVMWTSTFHLAGGEPGVIKMKIDPADLSYASITITANHKEVVSSARAQAMARHFLRNVAPGFNGDEWFDAGLAATKEHPERASSTRAERATFSMQQFAQNSGDRLVVEMQLNR